MRDERGARSYREKARNVEVVVTSHQSLLATITPIAQSCSQFRLLNIGNSGVGKSTLIERVFGVENAHTSENTRGEADIDREFSSPTNERFVVHDSLGFETADEQKMDTVKQFVARRKAMPQLKDQLHAIWLCLEIPYSGGRLLERGVEKFLQRRVEILSQTPLVVVLTKVDLLDSQLEIDLPTNETLEHYKSRWLDEHCIRPLCEAAGSDLPHVIVSVEDGYSESLSSLVKATNEAMAKYHVDEAPRIVASIAQRVSIKEKIELSITAGKKKYWKTVFRSHTLKECLQDIRKDIITVWNFNDPDQMYSSV
jgi:GTPase SAR1 family protein